MLKEVVTLETERTAIIYIYIYIYIYKINKCDKKNRNITFMLFIFNCSQLVFALGHLQGEKRIFTYTLSQLLLCPKQIRFKSSKR